jgi:hypothetical protein
MAIIRVSFRLVLRIDIPKITLPDSLSSGSSRTLALPRTSSSYALHLSPLASIEIVQQTSNSQFARLVYTPSKSPLLDAYYLFISRYHTTPSIWQLLTKKTLLIFCVGRLL